MACAKARTGAEIEPGRVCLTFACESIGRRLAMTRSARNLQLLCAQALP